jgi:hypothetical protein
MNKNYKLSLALMLALAVGTPGSVGAETAVELSKKAYTATDFSLDDLGSTLKKLADKSKNQEKLISAVKKFDARILGKDKKAAWAAQADDEYEKFKFALGMGKESTTDTDFQKISGLSANLKSSDTLVTSVIKHIEDMKKAIDSIVTDRKEVRFDALRTSGDLVVTDGKIESFNSAVTKINDLSKPANEALDTISGFTSLVNALDQVKGSLSAKTFISSKSDEMMVKLADLVKSFEEKTKAAPSIVTVKGLLPTTATPGQSQQPVDQTLDLKNLVKNLEIKFNGFLSAFLKDSEKGIVELSKTKDNDVLFNNITKINTNVDAIAKSLNAEFFPSNEAKSALFIPNMRIIKNTYDTAGETAKANLTNSTGMAGDDGIGGDIAGAWAAVMEDNALTVTISDLQSGTPSTAAPHQKKVVDYVNSFVPNLVDVDSGAATAVRALYSKKTFKFDTQALASIDDIVKKAHSLGRENTFEQSKALVTQLEKIKTAIAQGSYGVAEYNASITSRVAGLISAKMKTALESEETRIYGKVSDKNNAGFTTEYPVKNFTEQLKALDDAVKAITGAKAPNPNPELNKNLLGVPKFADLGTNPSADLINKIVEAHKAFLNTPGYLTLSDEKKAEYHAEKAKALKNLTLTDAQKADFKTPGAGPDFAALLTSTDAAAVTKALDAYTAFLNADYKKLTQVDQKAFLTRKDAALKAAGLNETETKKFANPTGKQDTQNLTPAQKVLAALDEIKESLSTEDFTDAKTSLANILKDKDSDKEDKDAAQDDLKTATETLKAAIKEQTKALKEAKKDNATAMRAMTKEEKKAHTEAIKKALTGAEKALKAATAAVAEKKGPGSSGQSERNSRNRRLTRSRTLPGRGKSAANRGASNRRGGALLGKSAAAERAKTHGRNGSNKGRSTNRGNQ